MADPLRIVYVAGPGDVAGTYAHWKDGRDDPSEVAVTYSGQFFDVCRERGAEAYVIASSTKPGNVRDGKFRIVHRPVPFARRSGLLYHLGQIWSGLRLSASAIRFGADVMVISVGAHYFSLRLLPLFGVKVIPTLHCVFWPKTRPRRGVGKFIQRLNARFMRRHSPAFLCVSQDIADQLRELVGPEEARDDRVFIFLPSYRRESFDDPPPAPPEPPPFRVLYAGRIERDKGVFGLLQIAERFRDERRSDVEFDLCGTGSALEELRRAAETAGVSAQFRCRGHADRPTMRKMYAAAHVVIVPTTAEFVEGFNKVVAEGVLAGRPVITSSACPALQYVRDAVVEVPVDDVRAYGDAILRLRDDAALYQQKSSACVKLREQFFDPANCWTNALKRGLHAAGVFGSMASASAERLPGVPSSNTRSAEADPT